MKQSKRLKKGFSLLELSIVLAIVSIVSVMAITFSALISGKITTGTKKLNFMQDVEVIEASLESWVDVLISEGAVFSVENGNVKATKNSTEYKVTFDDGVLKAILPTRTIKTNTETVDSISFDLITKNNEVLFFCTVTTTLKNAPSTYVFTINTYVGDVMGGGL